MAPLDLQSQWRSALASAGGRAMLAELSSAQIEAIAHGLEERDANDENALVRAALQIVDAQTTATPAAVYAHQLRCLSREARWRLGRLDRATFRRELDVEGAHWRDETRGAPTVLVLPMQLYTSDAVAIGTEAFPGRRLVFFGEDLAADNLAHVDARVEFAAQGLAGVRTIERALDDGGVFCTFADFVYAGRGAMPGQLFGCARAFASGFVQLAARPGCALLPLCTGERDGRIQLAFAEPLSIPPGTRNALRDPSNRAKLLRAIEAMLQSSIVARPHQWLLLNTLIAGAEQMAAQSRERVSTSAHERAVAADA